MENVRRNEYNNYVEGRVDLIKLFFPQGDLIA